ncbi:MAG: ABC transporter ATP-binding protein [Nitrososphaera sp.]
MESDRESLKGDELVICKNVGTKFSTGNPVPTVADLWDSFFTRNSQKEKPKFFWALRNISFSVKKGEILGLIGNNGAGKTTLLRIVSGVLRPDEGSVQVNTECSLLSPGLGQREQLTGRENIILGCLYLGYSVQEIKENFDRMVEFSELGEHINRPVRYYSDGMISRLTFTIATSLKPSFLLLDELLSAGDISFRDKAAKRMKEVVLNSKGAIIATHDMGFVENHCTKVLYLRNGEARFYGPTTEGIDLYKRDNGLA